MLSTQPIAFGHTFIRVTLLHYHTMKFKVWGVCVGFYRGGFQVPLRSLVWLLSLLQKEWPHAILS